MGFWSKVFKKFDKKERHYVSSTDQFLQKFDHEHPEKSRSQLKEIAKHKNIFYRSSQQPIKW
jgi:hypothetical protein